MTGQARIRQAGRLAAFGLIVGLALPAAAAQAATNDLDLVSRASAANGVKGTGSSFTAAISSDGRFVAFSSWATSLSVDDPDFTPDVFVRDLQTNTTTLVSRATGTTGAKGNGDSVWPTISSDGRFVVFQSLANNLSPDDDSPDFLSDVYVRDLQANTTTLVSRAGGAGGAKGNGNSNQAAISSDGRFISFGSSASNLSADDGDTGVDVFVRDVQANTTSLVSRAPGPSGVNGDGDSLRPAISGDGRFVAFESKASNMNSADGDTVLDVFVRDLQRNTTTLVSRAAGASGVKGNDASLEPAISGDARFVAFRSLARNLRPEDSDMVEDIYRRELGNNEPSAGADAYTAAQDTPLTVETPGVLANDSDPDGDPITETLVGSGPAHGTLALNANGSFTYTPASGYSGPDTFTYRATDGSLDSAPASVSITVSAAPAPPPPGPPAPLPAASPAPPAVTVKPICQGLQATIIGTAGRDVLRGTPAADVIVALGGNDVVRGLGGNDRVCAGAGNDRVDGGAGADRLAGAAGKDLLLGGPGQDLLLGGAGVDTLRGGPGKDRINGGAGRDRSSQ